MNRVADFFWNRLPAAAARVSRLMAGILADGTHLRAFPAVAGLLPPAALAFGFLLGWLRPGFAGQETAAGTLWILCLLVALGTQSAACGLWILLGYAVSDQFLAQHHPLAGMPPEMTKRLGLLIGYVVLAGWAVFNPLTARAAATALVRRPARAPGWLRIGIGAALFALVSATLAVLWMRAAAVLLRPIYTFVGRNPTRQVIEPLQLTWEWVAAAAVAAAIARVVIELIALRQPGMPVRMLNLRHQLARASWFAQLPVPVRAAAGALVFTGLLAGTYGGWLDAVVVFVLSLASLLVYRQLRRWIGVWAKWISAVPLAIRLLVGLPLLFGSGYVVLIWLWGTTHTLRPVLIGALLGALLVVVLLLPPRIRGVAHGGDADR